MAKKFKPIEAYEAWFKLHPGVSNPFDINTKEKYDFTMALIESYADEDTGQHPMRVGCRHSTTVLGCRKGRPEPWTKYAYWEADFPKNPASPGQTKVLIDRADVFEIGYDLYRIWYIKHPEYGNPVEIDMTEKYDYMKRIGWLGACIMQACRKAKGEDGKYHPWVKPEYWKKLKKEEEDAAEATS